MSFPRYLIRLAFDPAAQRILRNLQTRNGKLEARLANKTEEVRQLDRRLTAVLERNTGHIRDIKACGEALEDFDRVADALQHVTAERDQALARQVELEDQLTALAADNLEASGRLADLEERLAFSHNQADRAEAQVRDFARLNQHLAACPTAQAVEDHDSDKAVSNR